MEQILMVNFPAPYIFNGKKYSGLNIKWPEMCLICTLKTCEMSFCEKDWSICYKGICYKRIDDSLIIGGFVHKKMDTTKKHIKKAFRLLRSSNQIDLDVIESALRNIKHIKSDVIAQEKERIIESTMKAQSKAYNSKVISDKIFSALNQWIQDTHDWRQLLYAVMQNINVTLSERYGSTDENVFLGKATKSEKAIFYGCQLIKYKIDIMSIIHNLSSGNYSVNSTTTIELHRLVYKILRIYEEKFRIKKIEQKLNPSTVSIVTSPELISSLPHAIIDNALKYSPPGSALTIDFVEKKDSVLMKFKSFGPKILDHEKEEIFFLTKRGRFAAKISEDGVGFGLYAAKTIANKLNGDVTVEQDREESQKFPSFYNTVFVVELAKKL